MDGIFRFSNENLGFYERLYTFNDAKVLSVLGSGDQYFTSLLNGAKSVELFDINKYAWYYFILKFYIIKYLSYEMFYTNIVRNEIENNIIFETLKKYSTESEKEIIETAINAFGKKQIRQQFYDIKTDITRTIPYLNIDNYQILQGKLADEELPICHINDFFELIDDLSKNKYDILLMSNIYDWKFLVYDSEQIEFFKNELEKINCHEIQAFYKWKECPFNEDRLFLDAGFSINEIPTANVLGSKDKVFSLRR